MNSELASFRAGVRVFRKLIFEEEEEEIPNKMDVSLREELSHLRRRSAMASYKHNIIQSLWVMYLRLTNPMPEHFICQFMEEVKERDPDTVEGLKKEIDRTSIELQGANTTVHIFENALNTHKQIQRGVNYYS